LNEHQIKPPQKRKRKRKQSPSKKTKQNKTMYFNTLFFFWMSLLNALDFTIQDLSNPKEREREREREREKEVEITNLRK
jgi:hypothetical protein